MDRPARLDRRGVRGTARSSEGSASGVSARASSLGPGISNRALARLAKTPDGRLLMQRFVAGYAPTLAPGVAAPGGGAYVRGTQPAFYDETKDAVLARTETVVHNDPSGMPLLWAKCGACQNWGIAGDMQVGHVTKWLDYLDAVEPANAGEARQAYNDLDNLRMEHPGCNTSHAFEEALDEADWDTIPTDVLRELAALLAGTSEYGTARAKMMTDYADHRDAGGGGEGTA